MAETSILFDGNVSTERFAQMIGDMARNGVVGGAYGSLAPYADSTGMQVKRRSGAAFVGFDNGTVAQRRHYIDTAEKVLAIAGNTSGNPRIDRVVVRLDVNQADPANKVLTIIKQGTPAASPVPPALTRSGGIYELSLAQVAVANGAVTIAAANVTDEREDPAVCGYSNRSNQLRIYDNRPVSHRAGWITRVAGQTGAMLYLDTEDGAGLVQIDADGRQRESVSVPESGQDNLQALSGYTGTANRFGGWVPFKHRRYANPTVTIAGLEVVLEGSTTAAADWSISITALTPDGFRWQAVKVSALERARYIQFTWSI